MFLFHLTHSLSSHWFTSFQSHLSSYMVLQRNSNIIHNLAVAPTTKWSWPKRPIRHRARLDSKPDTRHNPNNLNLEILCCSHRPLHRRTMSRSNIPFKLWRYKSCMYQLYHPTLIVMQTGKRRRRAMRARYHASADEPWRSNQVGNNYSNPRASDPNSRVKENKLESTSNLRVRTQLY